MKIKIKKNEKKEKENLKVAPVGWSKAAGECKDRAPGLHPQKAPSNPECVSDWMTAHQPTLEESR